MSKAFKGMCRTLSFLLMAIFIILRLIIGYSIQLGILFLFLLAFFAYFGWFND